MSRSQSVHLFDGSGYTGYQEGLRIEMAGNRRNFWEDGLELILAMSMTVAALVYVTFFAEVSNEVMLVVISVAGSICALLAVFAYLSFRSPHIPPLMISGEGSMVLGRRRWPLDTIAEVELHGSTLTFRDRRMKVRFEARVFQVGDMESFVHALKRVAPEVIVRADVATTRPRQVRIPKS